MLLTYDEAGKPLEMSESLLQAIKTPNYWTKYRLLRKNDMVSLKDPHQLVSVTSEEENSIWNLIQQTWRTDMVGHGFDAVGLEHSNLKLISVQRLENPELFLTYLEALHTVAYQAQRNKSLIQPLADKDGPPKTSSFVLNRVCCSEVNEIYLFHGTAAENISAVISKGLDSRIAKSEFFGRGIYFSESPTKSDQYAGMYIMNS